MREGGTRPVPPKHMMQATDPAIGCVALAAPRSVVLQSACLEVEILPSHGGRIARLQAVDGGRRIDLLLPYAPNSKSARGGAFPLMPYANRIRDAAFVFHGRRISLACNAATAPHALHGVCRQLPWTLRELSQHKVVIAVEYEGEYWPWPIHAEQRFRLSGNTLEVSMMLSNAGKQPMPAGLGLHPYLSLGAGAVASLQAEGQWECDDDRFPVMCSRSHRTVRLDLQKWRDSTYYAHFSGWDGSALVVHADGCLTLQASAELQHIVCYAPHGAGWLCLEPMSHLTDAHNLGGTCASGGLAELAPGEAISASICFTWQPRR